MLASDELGLLIKSKYPVIFLESIDETYSMKQLKTIAEQLNLTFYEWSATNGLRKDAIEGQYFQSKEPLKMLQWVQGLLEPKPAQAKAGLFVLKDFDKYLKDTLTLRLFKDLINQIRGTANTIVILSAEYKVPKDIEADSAHLIGGYPSDQEIERVVRGTTEELTRTNRKVEASLTCEEFSRLAKTLRGLSTQQIRNVINQCLLDDNTFNIKDLSALEAYKKKIFDQDGLLEFYAGEEGNSLAGFDNLKRWLSDRKSSFNSDPNSSLPPPKGILLMGVQGCGKSLAVKIVAREFSLPLYRLDLGRLYSKYLGETEQNLRKALAIVEKLHPVCLWIDEIEKGFAASGGDIDGGVSQRILGTFLTWMQERSTSCFLSATANNIYKLPPEFLRKGRFDEIFFVDLPDAQSREGLFEIHLRKRGLDPAGFDLKQLVKLTANFSGAEIEQAIISALYRASTEKETLSTQHIADQINSTKPLSELKREDIAALRAWAKERTISA